MSGTPEPAPIGSAEQADARPAAPQPPAPHRVGGSAPPTGGPRVARPYRYRGEGTSWRQPWVWSFGWVVSRLLSLALFGFSWRHRERLPTSGPVLLISNHQSFLDPWLIGVACPRQVHYMARDTLFKGGFLQWLGETLNAYPVRRGSADLAAIRMTIERLEAGRLVNVFPEGTRTLDGTIGAVAPGVALIVQRARCDVPLVPVLIDGTFEAWPRTARLPHPHKVRFIFGQPILPAEYRTLKPAQLAERLRAALVDLQAEIGSSHAQASRRRLAESAA